MYISRPRGRTSLDDTLLHGRQGGRPAAMPILGRSPFGATPTRYGQSYDDLVEEAAGLPDPYLGGAAAAATATAAPLLRRRRGLSPRLDPLARAQGLPPFVSIFDDTPAPDPRAVRLEGLALNNPRLGGLGLGGIGLGGLGRLSGLRSLNARNLNGIGRLSSLSSLRDLNGLNTLNNLNNGVCPDCMQSATHVHGVPTHAHAHRHRHTRAHRHHHTTVVCSDCESDSDDDDNGRRDNKKKAVVVRGKLFNVRKSFLEESSKFEGDLTNYMDKKKEEQVPDRVVKMLIDFINDERCNGRSLHDWVTLNVLASNLGSKSVVSHSLTQIKKRDIDDVEELTNICVTILLSSKVDDGLVAWLKETLKEGNTWQQLASSYSFNKVISKTPELQTATMRLVGMIDSSVDDKLPIL